MNDDVEVAVVEADEVIGSRYCPLSPSSVEAKTGALAARGRA